MLLSGDEGLASLLSNQLDAGSGSASYGKESDLVGLGNDGRAGVVAAGIAFPVRVVGDVAGRDGDGVVVLCGIVGAGGG